MTEQPPILYWANGSIPSWQVMLLLHEKQVDFEARRLRVMSTPKETRTPEFLAINPRGQVPVWVEPGGLVLRESRALLFYLERCYPEPSMLPDELEARAVVLQRMFEVEELRRAYRPLEQLFLGAQSLDARALDAAKAAPERVARELVVWEDYVGQAEFLAGDVFSMADCVFYPALAYMCRRGLALTEWPALEAYRAKVSTREAAQASHPEGWKPGRSKDLFALARSL